MRAFPTVQKPSYQTKPARVAWNVRAGEVLSADLPCGRDLTGLAAMMYIYSGGLSRHPVALNCEIVDGQGGVVRVSYDTKDAPAGTWPWTLFIVAPVEPIAAYTGTIKIEQS